MIKPKTRKEVFMDAIAKGKKPTIEPLTREEVLMAEHAEREASGGGGSAALVITLQRGGAVEANMPFNEAHNSVLSGASPMLINYQAGIPEIWYFKGGLFGDNYLSVMFGSRGGNEKDIYYSASGSLYEQEEEG